MMFKRLLILPLLGTLIYAQTALAVPITLAKGSAAGPARSDPGSGLCGLAVHFKAQGTPLSLISQAITLLDSPSGSAIAARSSALVPSVNLRNASASARIS